MKSCSPAPPLALLATLLAGCASQLPLRTTSDPCQRVRIEPAPLWTASAAWTPGEDRLLLIGPGSHKLLLYNLDGELEREVEIDALAELEYASPIRLEATDDGYLLGDKTQILWLDRSFRKRRLWRVFEHLKPAGVAAGNISDFAVLGRTVYAYADFLWEEGGPDPHPRAAPSAETAPAGGWFRGFARIDLDEPELVTLHRFGLEDGEGNAYYFYDRRPYVTDLGKRAYVLRYSEPPQILRSSKKTRDLEPVYSAAGDEDFDVSALYAWDGRLYLLASRKDEPETAAGEPAAPQLVENASTRARLRDLQKAKKIRRQRFLVEIDPKTGRTLGQFRLPTEADQVKLLPGNSHWALIEETSLPNIADEDETHLMLLPSSWLVSQKTKGPAPQVTLECPKAG